MIFASWFVMRYARQVQQDKSRSVLADIVYDDEFSQMTIIKILTCKEALHTSIK